MNRSVLRAAVGSLCAVLALACSVALGGCSGENPEELIRQDLTTSFDEIKNLDDATIDELAQELGTSDLETYGIDGADLIRSMVDGFDYTIDSVTVDEEAGTATASVTVTSKSMSSLYDQIESMIGELMNDPDFLTLASDEDALNARVGEMIMEAVDGIEPTEKSLSISYSKTDDGWQVDSSAESEMATIFV